MAKIGPLIPKILKWEGGSKFTNDPIDKGGATKYGVTEGTWERVGHDKDHDGDIDSEDVRLLDLEDFKIVLKVGYWDQWRADKIINQSLAEILVDWVWGSGVWGIKIPQRLLGLKEDGLVGNITITALNAQDPKEFHVKIVQARSKFITGIIERDIDRVEAKLGKKLTEKEKLKLTNKRFEKGWFNRLADFKYSP